jgi:hypothetical protein
VESASTSFPVPCPAVALIVFNRPAYTARVLAAIRAATPPRLFVIADGPRFGRVDDRESCSVVRKLVDDTVDWDCEVTRLYSGTNLGCASRVASGLEALFDTVEEAIILEDDCVPAPSFIPFCSSLLAQHRNNGKIGMIAGTNYRGASPVGRDSYFFSAHHSIWGWATWRRVFAGFDPAMSAWRTTVHPADIAPNWADKRSQRLHELMFDAFREGAIDSWGVPWVFHLARHNQLSAVAGANLVSNIGLEGTRGRSGDRNNNMAVGSLDFPLKHPVTAEPNPDYDRLVAGRHRLFRDWMRSLWTARARNFFGSPR